MATILFILSTIISLGGNPFDHQAVIYPKSAIVTEVNYHDDYIVLLDLNGDEWLYDGAEDWLVGDFVAMMMWNNDTLDIYDDEIISIRYEGYCDDWDE